MAIPQEEIDADRVELAKKLISAYVAHCLGLKGIDRARKEYVDGNSIEPSRQWIELAKQAQMIQQSMGVLGVPVYTTKKQ